MLPPPQLNPAHSYGEALQRVAALQRFDDENILPQARTVLHDCGKRTPLAVVLLHGFTNHPAQYRAFAPLLFEHGVNVLVPRMPEQGDRDRLTRRMSRLTAESLLARAWEAVDLAQGLGERVCVAGISSSGLLSAYFAQYRSDVARAIAIAPVFAILNLPHWLSRVAEQAMLALPDRYLWWDPRLREAQHPATAYPWFSTHALAQTLRVGDAVYARARRAAPAASSVVFVTNALDPAVNNAPARQVARAWNRHRAGAAMSYEFDDLPCNHDIIEPDNPKASLEIVYPRLLEFVLTTPS